MKIKGDSRGALERGKTFKLIKFSWGLKLQCSWMKEQPLSGTQTTNFRLLCLSYRITKISFITDSPGVSMQLFYTPL